MNDAQRSGRPKHRAFDTKEKVDQAIDLCEDLPDGLGKVDAAKKLGCCEKTLYNNTHKEVNWRVTPLQDRNANDPKVKRKRKAFAVDNLTPTGRLSKKIRTATTIDHKWMHLYGENRRNRRQCRRIGSTKPLRTAPKSTTDPKVMGMFAANAKGTAVFWHASKRPLKQGENKGKLTLDKRTVDGPELARGLKKTIIPFMRKTGCTTAFMDCVPVNHCPAVREAFNKAGMKVIPSAGKGHNVPKGSPPLSHDLSILDGNLFATLQHDASRATLRAIDAGQVEGQSETCELIDQTNKLWKSRKYKEKAKNAMKKLENAFKMVVECDGGPTGR